MILSEILSMKWNFLKSLVSPRLFLHYPNLRFIPFYHIKILKFYVFFGLLYPPKVRYIVTASASIQFWFLINLSGREFFAKVKH